MAIDYAALKTELLTAPYAAMVAAGNDQGCANALNAKNVAVTIRLPLVELEKYLQQQGLITSLEDYSTGGAQAGVKQACRQVMKMLSPATSRLTDVDSTKTPFQQGLNGMVAVGLITAQQQADILALASSLQSRAEQMFGTGTVIGQADVSFALRGQK